MSNYEDNEERYECFFKATEVGTNKPLNFSFKVTKSFLPFLHTCTKTNMDKSNTEETFRYSKKPNIKI